MAVEFVDWGLRTSLAIAVAVVVVLALRMPVRRAFGATATLCLWLLLPAALLATSLPKRADAPSAASAVQPIAGSRAMAFATDVAAPAGITASRADASAGSAPAGPGAVAASVAGAFALPRIDPAVAFWLTLGWAAGALAAALAFVAQQRRFHRRIGALQPRGDGSWRAANDRVGPVLVGVWRPRIVVPRDFDARFDREQQALVLAHERVHLRRGDLQVNLAMCALRCVLWFHPLVHVAGKRLRFDQEHACDAAVLRRHPSSGRAYATALLETQLTDPGLPVGCHWQSSHPLKWRISMMKRPLPGPARVAFGVGLALLASSATAISMWRMQPAAMSTFASVEAAAAAPARDVPLLAAAPADVPSPAPRAATPIDESATGGSAGSPALGSPVAESPVAESPVAETPAEFLPAPVAPAPDAPVDDAPVTDAPVVDASVVDASPRTGATVSAVPLVPPVAVETSRAKASRSMRQQHGDALPTVFVQVDVDAEGRPSNATFVAGDVGRYHRDTAERAVLRWTFEPARRDGAAVPATVVVPVDYATSPSTAARIDRFWADAVRHERPMPGPPLTPSAALRNR